MKKIIFVLVLMSCLLSFQLQAVVDMNDIVPAFPEGDRAAIETSVIEGAVRFLQAKSYADLLLCEVEKSARAPFNHVQALNYAEKSLAELTVSLSEYTQSLDLAGKAGVLPDMKTKFKTFNYDGYALEKSLDGDMMALVKAYFSTGDIPAAYRQNVENLDDIKITLIQIKETLGQGQTPELALYWQLLQRFAKASLFGNYCTMVATSVFNR